MFMVLTGKTYSELSVSASAALEHSTHVEADIGFLATRANKAGAVILIGSTGINELRRVVLTSSIIVVRKNALCSLDFDSLTSVFPLCCWKSYLII